MNMDFWYGFLQGGVSLSLVIVASVFLLFVMIDISESRQARKNAEPDHEKWAKGQTKKDITYAAALLAGSALFWVFRDSVGQLLRDGANGRSGLAAYSDIVLSIVLGFMAAVIVAMVRSEIKYRN